MADWNLNGTLCLLRRNRRFAAHTTRGLPALLVRRGGDRILVDCGEGTQRQLLRSIGLTDLDEIFITHLDADHWLGLPGMLKTFDLRDRERSLYVHGPRGLRDLVQRMMRYAGTTYDLYVVELEAGEILERDGYEIEAVAAALLDRTVTPSRR